MHMHGCHEWEVDAGTVHKALLSPPESIRLGCCQAEGCLAVLCNDQGDDQTCPRFMLLLKILQVLQAKVPARRQAGKQADRQADRHRLCCRHAWACRVDCCCCCCTHCCRGRLRQGQGTRKELLQRTRLQGPAHGPAAWCRWQALLRSWGRALLPGVLRAAAC